MWFLTTHLTASVIYMVLSRVCFFSIHHQISVTKTVADFDSANPQKQMEIVIVF